MSASAQLSPVAYNATAALKPQARVTAANRHVFVVCSGESCRDAGAEHLLGVLQHESNHQCQGHDLRISSSKCLGRCGIAPAMVENGKVLGWVSPSRLKSELRRLGLLNAVA